MTARRIPALLRRGGRAPQQAATPTPPFTALSAEYFAAPSRLDVTFSDDVDPAFVSGGAYDFPLGITYLSASVSGPVVTIDIDTAPATPGAKTIQIFEARRLSDGAQIEPVPTILPWVLP